LSKTTLRAGRDLFTAMEEHQEDFINFATVDNLTQAESLSRKLGVEGIPTRVYDERDVQRFVFMTKPKGYSFVQVREKDYTRAAALLQEWELEDPELASHVFNCPECGSFAVEYPQFTRKFLITPLHIELMSSLGLFKKQFYCRKCHATWLPEANTVPSPAPRRRMAAEALTPPPD
jgi:transposase-like protein